MSEPYRGSRPPHCHWRPTLAASLVLRVSVPSDLRREERLAEGVFAHERLGLHLSSATVSKHTSSAARTGTAVGRTSLSFSDPHPQAPPALWGTGTTGEPWDHTRGIDYTLWLIFVSTRLPAAR